MVVTSSVSVPVWEDPGFALPMIEVVDPKAKCRRWS
jgi:hypothetical protein